jgi:hypothetical protein
MGNTTFYREISSSPVNKFSGWGAYALQKINMYSYLSNHSKEKTKYWMIRKRASFYYILKRA